MTRHEDFSNIPAAKVVVTPQSYGAVEATRREKEDLFHQNRNEAVAGMKADPFYMMGAKVTGYALALASATVVLTAIVVGLMG
ncbi:MAG: hypothetical protein AAGH74_11725 [Pseudomonadota bacterium]